MMKAADMRQLVDDYGATVWNELKGDEDIERKSVDRKSEIESIVF